MHILNFEPKNGENWSIEHAKGYYLQQIALQLEQSNKLLNELKKDLNYWRKANDQVDEIIYSLNTAISLLTHKQEIIEFFEGAESMRLSEFRNKLLDISIYCGGNNLLEAIKVTDYLEVKKAGSGFRVWLIL